MRLFDKLCQKSKADADSEHNHTLPGSGCMSVPIIIGVTGHRDLREQDVPQLRELVHAELIKLKTEYPHSPLMMLNSLAAGADTLCAQAAVELGITLVCPLPMEVDDYRQDFEGEELERFTALLKKADEVFVAPDTEPAPQEMTRDFCYRQAGIYIASHSHVLLALWDGAPAKAYGCGTAEAVSFMLHGEYTGAGSCFHAENDGAVIHIRTPRKSRKSSFPICVELLENRPGSLSEVLKMTDRYNTDTSVTYDNPDLLLPEELLEKADSRTKRLHAVYLAADAAALRFQKKYLEEIRSFSVFGMLLVLLFLFYDELESNLFLICYGILIVIYAAAYLISRRGKSHERYLQYRVLSETVRTQFYLCADGINDNIAISFTWTQKFESTWIREAVSSLLIGAHTCSSIAPDIIKEYWIEGQLAYHKKALARSSHKHKISRRTAGALLAASVILFIGVVFLEFCIYPLMDTPVCSGSFSTVFMHHEGQAFTLRSLLKIILGAISAGAAFLTNYFGKLSLERKNTDHEKMAALYAAAKHSLENKTHDRARILNELAREEIIECSNWFSYCRENPPSFDI